MAALPLTLETLKSPSNESLLSSQSPLISPQCLKANSLSTTASDMDTTPERPSNLTIDSAHQMQKQQQHSNATPSSSTATLHGNISPALSSAGSLSPSFLPEMPQWKRDLIQRRKQNVQRTISASSPTSSSSGLSLSPTTTALACGGLKTSISPSSVRSLGGSNTNIDQLASDGLQQVGSTKDYAKTSLLSYGNATVPTTTINKQYNTTTSTNTLKPATNIKSSTTLSSSPLKERAEKLFGGQYTAAPAKLTTFSTKEEIATPQPQQLQQQQQPQIKENIQENNKMMEENEEEHFEMYRKTKEVINDEETTIAFNTNKQQKATRLTGSAYNNISTTNTSAASSSSSSASATASSTSTILKRAETDTREKLLNATQQYHSNIIGANVNLVNQSLNKCESERLVCAANTTGNTYNLNNSATIGGISVSGINISNSQNSCSNVTNVVKISQKLQENQFIKNEQQLNTKKIIKYKQNTLSGGNNISLDLKSPTKISHVLTTSNSTSCLTTSSSSAAATSSSTNCATKKKMVAVQEMKKSTQNSATHLHPITSTCHATNRANNRAGIGGDTDLDTSEDLSYGPGIVSKLRCRYLSLALRESMEQQRLIKDQLRRSTSLNNLLDNTEDEENCEEDEEESPQMVGDDLDNQGFEYKAVIKDNQSGDGLNNVESTGKKTGILKTTVNSGPDKRFANNTQGSNGVGVTFTETAYSKRSRHLKRGNDSLKRARSVEALLSEKSPWHTRANCTTPTCITIEDKIHNARERLQQGSDHMPPKRLTSIIDDTERPPPDLVKQTLKMFEATANRRPRSTNRSNSKGEVASKVETFKNIIKEQKPIVTFPKPSSPTKKMNTPQTLHKPLKASTPQANDLLQSPLGRKTMAAATSMAHANDCLTPLKSTNNTLSDYTPDIIPRQKFGNERDFKQNKEIFSSKEKLLATSEREFESPLSNIKRELSKEKCEVVDSPLTALTKELAKLKLNDHNTTRKTDNSGNGGSGSGSDSDNHDTLNNMGSVGGGGGDNKSGDACQRHDKYPYNNSKNDFVNEETTQKELNISSLKNENDKINNKTKSNSNNKATSSLSPSTTTIETKNEATVNNYNDSLTKAASPPPSSSDLSDVGENYDDDENGSLETTKRITRTALDNISKAGYTQQFKFNSTTTQNSATSSAASSSSSTSSCSNTNNLSGGKQVGVIRPLLNTQQQEQQQQQKSKDTNMETFKQSNTTSPLTSREIEKNRINDLKKSSTTSGPCSAPAVVTSSPSASLDHHHHQQVINSSSPATASPSAVNNSASGLAADVDSVISATNSPLWAMRKRRQSPPAAPAENTSMVFNFSNRKEVPDYIENDGVIFRRKKELPKPNESGFVLLGDLSVETSTDMDYDDFSMCPPSPCDVEFANANIVIDGKSSIRQKSKDTPFRVQFNDTLTSTFEYPSEASLIGDESSSGLPGQETGSRRAYNKSYSESLGDFVEAFEELMLRMDSDTHHHVADEIIQLPTLNSSSPAAAAAAATNTSSPTKNVLGNLPLDYPDLQKGIQLATATQPTTRTPNATSSILTTTEDNNKQLQQQLGTTIGNRKKSRKDLKLPLVLGLQPSLSKPPLPVKRFPMTNPAAAGLPQNLLHSKNLPTNLKVYEEVKQQQQQFVKRSQLNDKAEVLPAELPPAPRQRKTPRVLNNPQYACFLQETKNCATKPIQRSRSNEFQTTFNTLSVSATVSRSNSLRNLEYVPAIRANSQLTQSSAIDSATSLCFPSEVNSNAFLNNPSDKEMAKNPIAFKPPPAKQFLNSAKESPRKFENTKNYHGEPHEFSQSLSNLTEQSQSILNLKENMSRSVDSIEFANLKCFTDQCTKSLENFKTSALQVTAEDIEIGNNKNNRVPQNAIHVATPASLSKHLKTGMPVLNTSDRLSPENPRELGKKQENRYDVVNRNEEQVGDIICNCEINSHSIIENTTNNLILIEKKQMSALETQSTALQLEKNSENQIKTAGDAITNTTTDVGVCLTVNSKYVTDYRSKITKNLIDNELKVKENVKTYKNLTNASDLLKESLRPKLNQYNFQDSNILEGNINAVAINSDNLTKENDLVSVFPEKAKLNEFNFQDSNSLLKTPNVKSNYQDNISLKVNKSSIAINPDNLAKENDLGSVSQEKAKLNKSSGQDSNKNSIANNSDNLKETKALGSLSKDISNSHENSSQMVVHSNEIFMNSADKTKDNLKEKSNSADALNLTTGSQADILNRSRSLNDVQMVVNNNYLIGHNVESKIDLEPLEIITTSSEEKLENIHNDSKSLQMSTDSLDQFAHAQDQKEKVSLTDAEAAEILEDIAIDCGTTSLLHYNNSHSLKRSKTAYCLQSLENSISIESEDALQRNDDNDDDSNFITACNTLESKCPLKSHEPPEMATNTCPPSSTMLVANEVPEALTKRSKTLRTKTAEKIINFTNLASQNISTYATFSKSKSFCKNASKSFKNSLRFYETFDEKPATGSSLQCPAEKSIPITENQTKKTDLNRKIFSKSSKIMRKLGNSEEWESPTENSNSFEYFDAENGLNGNLVNLNNKADLDHDKVNSDSGIEKSVASGNIRVNEKSITLKPPTTDFYFNSSPRPFKPMYETITLVKVEEYLHKHQTSLTTESDQFAQQRAKSFSFYNRKPALSTNLKKSDSFNTFSRNVHEKVEIFNRNANQVSEVSFTNNNLNKLNENSTKLQKPLKTSCSTSVPKSPHEIETFMRNDQSTRFSFNLTKFSASSPKLVERSPLNTESADQTNSFARNPKLNETPNLGNGVTAPVNINPNSGSAPLGFYTPVKAPIDRLFQLGVTRAPSLLSNDSPTETTATTTSSNGRLLNGIGNGDDGFGDGNGSIVGISGGLLNDDDDGDYGEHKKKVNNADDEPESLQYIKPAEDDLNIAYSEGTQKTDLLY